MLTYSRTTCVQLGLRSASKGQTITAEVQNDVSSSQ